jgi:hypothetical protein
LACLIDDMTETLPQDDSPVMTGLAEHRYSRPAMDGLQHAGAVAGIDLPYTDRFTTHTVSIAGHDRPDIEVLKELASVTPLGGWLVLDVLNGPCVSRDVEVMLAECGFRVRDVYGDYHGTPLVPESARVVVVARRVLLRGC